MLVLALGTSIDVSSWTSVPESLTVVEVQLAGPRYDINCRMLTDGVEVGHASNSWDTRAAGAVGRWLVSVAGGRHEDVAARSATVLFPERDAELVATIVSRLQLDVALVFDEPVYDGTILRLENRARACYVTRASALAAWSGQHVVPATLIDIHDPAAISSTFDAGSETSEDALDGRLHPTPLDDARHQPTRILLVSYFASPTTPVSTIRLGYWHDQLSALARADGRSVEVTWLSATRQAAGRPDHIVVTDPGDEAATSSTLTDLERMGLPTIGASWAARVREEAVRWEQGFDVVVVSVGPYGYLDLAVFFREVWQARTIIDFRDPYGGDARMNYSVAQREWINRFERDVVRSVDAIVSVNQQCLDTIARGVDVERAIVANGFDARQYESLPSPAFDGGRPVELIYTGTIFRALPIDLVLDVLDPARARLTHYGRDQTESQTVAHHPAARRGGFISDPDVLASRLASADLGIVRTSGEATTQTTKIFDYIGAGIEILIVTDGTVGAGSLGELTAGLDGVYWCRNRREDIEAFFAAYEPRRPNRPQRARFSREHWARRLLELALDQPPAPGAEPMSPSQVLTPVDRVEEALSAIRYEVAALRADVRAAEQELQRVARGHASNARSIRGHADELRRLGERSDALRLDRQLRAIPSRGRRRIARRLGRDDAISQSPTISPPTAASRVAGPPTILIVANAYPTTAREYGGQHIARRVLHYRRSGYGVVVFVPTNTNDRRDVVDALGARVIVGPIDSLPQRIVALGPVAIAVHSPLPETWAVVKPATDDIATFVWIHGFEARDWRSLSFDFTPDEIERDGPRLDAVNTERRRVLTEIFGNRSVETIFVSSFMRTVAEDFVGLQADRGHVIHNVIDPTVFQYREKSAGDRFKIVSVRSFDRRNYGTDLVSLAVQRLRRERWFNDLAVTIVGEGRYFESDTAPLAGIPQVQLRRQLLQAVELDELFAGNGISLCPTRWDSQGMVMGESMSCGLVPVTNGVTAIPEFVDETTAALTGPEDDAGLAAAIAEMIDDPDLFLSRSRAAHARVEQQCGPEQTVRRELDLFDRALL